MSSTPRRSPAPAAFTVVVPDLRGYGASGKPAGGDPGELYAKRAMAADQVAVMTALGFDRFAVSVTTGARARPTAWCWITPAGSPGRPYSISCRPIR